MASTDSKEIMSQESPAIWHSVRRALLSFSSARQTRPLSLSQISLTSAKGGMAGGVNATISEAGSAEAVIPLGSDSAREMLGGGMPSELRVILEADGMTCLAKGVFKKTNELRRTGQISGGL